MGRNNNGDIDHNNNDSKMRNYSITKKPGEWYDARVIDKYGTKYQNYFETEIECEGWVYFIFENEKKPLTHEEEMDYAATLNRVLPEDIQVIAWCPVPDHFSARFSCSYRLYRYYFAKRLLNLEKMKEAGLQLQGRHDYRNFCKMDAVNVRNYEREVLSFDIRPATPSAAVGHVT